MRQQAEHDAVQGFAANASCSMEVVAIDDANVKRGEGKGEGSTVPAPIHTCAAEAVRATCRFASALRGWRMRGSQKSASTADRIRGLIRLAFIARSSWSTRALRRARILVPAMGGFVDLIPATCAAR